MFTYDLAELLKPKGVIVNCLDPGTVNTKLLIAGWGACGIDIKVVTATALSTDLPSVLADKLCTCQLKLHILPASLQPERKQAVYLVHAMGQLEHAFVDTESYVWKSMRQVSCVTSLSHCCRMPILSISWPLTHD